MIESEGLGEFWECLGTKAQKNLMKVDKESVIEQVVCTYCKGLLVDATKSLDYVARVSSPKQTSSSGRDGKASDGNKAPTSTNIMLSRSSSGAFICSKGGPLETPKDGSDPKTTPYADYNMPYIVLLDQNQLDDEVRSMGRGLSEAEAAAFATTKAVRALMEARKGFASAASGSIKSLAGVVGGGDSDSIKSRHVQVAAARHIQAQYEQQLQQSGELMHTIQAAKVGPENSQELNALVAATQALQRGAKLVKRPAVGRKGGGGGGGAGLSSSQSWGGSALLRGKSNTATPPACNRRQPPQQPPQPLPVPESGNEVLCCGYCCDKLRLKFVDTLTYPRPVRQFNLLMDQSTTLSQLRKMMAAEVGQASLLPSSSPSSPSPTTVGELVLMTRGKALPVERGTDTLLCLGFKNNQQVVISRVLGKERTGRGKDSCPAKGNDGVGQGKELTTRTETAAEEEEEEVAARKSAQQEKNRKFVGDLLFGNSGYIRGGGRSVPGGGGGRLGLSIGPTEKKNRLGDGGGSGCEEGALMAGHGVHIHSNAAVGNACGGGGVTVTVSAGSRHKEAVPDHSLNLAASLVCSGSCSTGSDRGGGSGGGDAKGGDAKGGGSGGGGKSGVGVPPLKSAVVSMVDVYRVNHGLQLLSSSLLSVVKANVHDAWREEEDAKKHAQDLLALLEADGNGSPKKASKREKEKQKKKKREEAAQKKKEADAAAVAAEKAVRALAVAGEEEEGRLRLRQVEVEVRRLKLEAVLQQQKQEEERWAQVALLQCAQQREETKGEAELKSEIAKGEEGKAVLVVKGGAEPTVAGEEEEDASRRLANRAAVAQEQQRRLVSAQQQNDTCDLTAKRLSCLSEEGALLQVRAPSPQSHPTSPPSPPPPAANRKGFSATAATGPTLTKKQKAKEKRDAKKKKENATAAAADSLERLSALAEGGLMVAAQWVSNAGGGGGGDYCSSGGDHGSSAPLLTAPPPPSPHVQSMPVTSPVRACSACDGGGTGQRTSGGGGGGGGATTTATTTTTPRFCHHCGGSLVAGSRFCSACGTSVVQVAVQTLAPMRSAAVDFPFSSLSAAASAAAFTNTAPQQQQQQQQQQQFVPDAAKPSSVASPLSFSAPSAAPPGLEPYHRAIDHGPGQWQQQQQQQPYTQPPPVLMSPVRTTPPPSSMLSVSSPLLSPLLSPPLSSPSSSFFGSSLAAGFQGSSSNCHDNNGDVGSSLDFFQNLRGPGGGTVFGGFGANADTELEEENPDANEAALARNLAGFLG